jgi:site-specific DNA-methyltransferase (adenine-specific)
MSIDLRCGDWRDVLADVGEVGCVVTDPPYSERTHGSYREMAEVNRRAISYAAWTPDDVRAFVQSWHPRTTGWIVALTDHELIPAWQAAFVEVGRYSFAPLACVEPGSRVRISGDGPSQWSVFAMVARPSSREFQRWGALRGAYVLPYELTRRGASEGNGVMGGKPLALMRDLIRDYSRTGDLCVDPCAGGGTTLLAAAIEGRRAVGAERDPDTFAKAQARIAKGYTPVMRFDALDATQESLFTDGTAVEAVSGSQAGARESGAGE